MKNKNRKRIISLVLCFSILLGIKHSYNLYMKKHPEKLFNLNSNDKIITMVDDDYDDLNIIPALGSMVPQGIAMNDEYIFLSMYDSLKISRSMIYVFDFDFNLKRKVLLDSYSHVGGIAIDEVNNCIWTSGTYGSVCAYSIDDILSKKEVNALFKDDTVGENLINYRGQRAVSFLTIDDSKLFVGNYTCIDDGTLKVYDICNEDGKLSLEYITNYSIPTMVQGVSFYVFDEQEYILFSRSCGDGVDSFVQMYKFDEKFDYHNTESVNFRLDPMLEQICVDDNRMLNCVFESNAVPYKGKDKENDFRVFSLKKQLKKSEN